MSDQKLNQKSKKSAYRQPKVYSLGSIEKVEGYPSGRVNDGAGGSFFYDP